MLFGLRRPIEFSGPNCCTILRISMISQGHFHSRCSHSHRELSVFHERAPAECLCSWPMPVELSNRVGAWCSTDTRERMTIAAR